MTTVQDVISLKIPHQLTTKLDIIAQLEDRSRSSLIRRLIVDYIENYKDINDAFKARAKYEKNPKDSITLEEFMRKSKISKKELDKISLD